MKPNHLPRDPPPSLLAILVTLMLAVGCVLETLWAAVSFVQWWMGWWA